MSVLSSLENQGSLMKSLLESESLKAPIRRAKRKDPPTDLSLEAPPPKKPCTEDLDFIHPLLKGWMEIRERSLVERENEEEKNKEICHTVWIEKERSARSNLTLHLKIVREKFSDERFKKVLQNVQKVKSCHVSQKLRIDSSKKELWRIYGGETLCAWKKELQDCEAKTKFMYIEAVCRQILELLRDLPQKFMLNKDLSPDNIRMQGLFVLCCSLENSNSYKSQSLNASKQCPCAIEHRSIEELVEDKRGVKSDIWRFGYILYELLMDKPLLGEEFWTRCPLKKDREEESCLEAVFYLGKKIGFFPCTIKAVKEKSGWKDLSQRLKNTFEKVVYYQEEIIERYRGKISKDRLDDLLNLLKKALEPVSRTRQNAKQLLKERFFCGENRQTVRLKLKIPECYVGKVHVVVHGKGNSVYFSSYILSSITCCHIPKEEAGTVLLNLGDVEHSLLYDKFNRDKILPLEEIIGEMEEYAKKLSIR